MIQAKRRLVLVGGLAMRAQDFSTLSASLSERGIEALTFDNLAVGDGPRPTDVSILSQAKHAWQVVEQSLGTEPVHIFGISMGGMIAATMATLRPAQVATLTLGATSPNTAEIPAVADALYDPWINVQSREDLYACVEIAFGKTTLATKSAIVNDYFLDRLHKKNGQSRGDFIAQLDAIRAFPGAVIYTNLASLDLDSMLISGDEDRLFPAEHTRYIRDFVKKHTELTETGHMLHLENPKMLAEILLTRLAR